MRNDRSTHVSRGACDVALNKKTCSLYWPPWFAESGRSGLVFTLLRTPYTMGKKNLLASSSLICRPRYPVHCSGTLHKLGFVVCCLRGVLRLCTHRVFVLGRAQRPASAGDRRRDGRTTTRPSIERRVHAKDLYNVRDSVGRSNGHHAECEASGEYLAGEDNLPRNK